MAPGTPSVPVAASSHKASPAPTADRLWLFDFDYTIIADNSDTYIHRCAPGGQLPPAVRDSYVAPDWIGYMNRVLSHLAGGGAADGAEAAAVSPEAIKAELERIPWTPGMRRLLEAIRDSGSSSSNAGSSSSNGSAATAGGSGGLAGVNHAAILSDANSLFIPWILDGGGGGGGSGGSDQQGGTHDGVAPDVIANAKASAEGQAQARLPPLSPMFVDILTNPAQVEALDAATANGSASTCSGVQAAGAPSGAAATGAGAGGVIRVYPHHGTARQCAAPPHACRRCHANLCKRQAMRQLLQRRAAAGFTYRQVVYVGDGRNDLCPCLALGPGDVAMPRVGFALQKLLAAAAAATTANATATACSTAVPKTEAPAAVPPASTATGPGGGNDDFIYATAAAAAAPAAAAAAAVPAAGPEPEPLLAVVVPWRDAYDILAWAAADDKRAWGANAAEAAGQPAAEGLADSAARMKL